MGKIVEALELKSGETIVEIGPGHGELTRELRKKNKESGIFAIEKDKNLAGELEKEIGDAKTKIIAGDALKILPSITRDSLFRIQDYKVVGNIPYYITGRLLRVIGELETPPKLTILTVQKEVAERICAKPKIHPVRGRLPSFDGELRTVEPQGSRSRAFGRVASNGMNLLAAAVQFWAEPEIIGFIPRKDFRPRPKVDSAIIRLRTKKYEHEIEENYYKLVKILFKQPRKTIMNNLKNLISVKKEFTLLQIRKADIDITARPQNLSLENIKKLARIVYNQ